MLNRVFKFFEGKINPFDIEKEVRLPESIMSFLYISSKGMRGMLFGLSFMSALNGALEALLFGMLGSVVDWISTSAPSTFFEIHKYDLALMGLLIALSWCSTNISSLIRNQALGTNYALGTLFEFHKAALAHSMEFYQNEHSGKISAKVLQSAPCARESLMIITDVAAYVSVYFFVMIAVAFTFEKALLIPFIVWLILYVESARRLVPEMRRRSNETANARSDVNGKISDSYANAVSLKLFSSAKQEASWSVAGLKEYQNIANNMGRVATKIELSNSTLSMLLFASSVLLALYMWTQGECGPGAAAAVGSMALRLIGMAHWVMWESGSFFDRMGTLKDGLDLLRREVSVKDEPKAPDLVIRGGEIKFENVSFGYSQKEGGAKIFDSFDLVLGAGKKIGIVGRSGSGKTTIASLILRLFDVQGGNISIDGQDIKKISQNSLRAQIGMVAQESSLLNRSIRENIAFGSNAASFKEVERAARLAHCDFIESLEDKKGNKGYEALVGERGAKLSGGQKQRIAIARVMLKNAKILILDEATSALDSESEALITDGLEVLMKGKTVVAIAHRLSTICAMDVLVVLDRGRIAQMGSHIELLAEEGIYANLWKRQSGGFIPEDPDIKIE